MSRFVWFSINLFLLPLFATASYFNKTIADCYLRNKGSSNILNCGPLVNDPDFPRQWYLVPRQVRTFGNRVSLDLGIIDVWIKYEYMGAGVTVVIYDDGLEIMHPDLVENYAPELSWDYCYDQPTPTPRPGSYHAWVRAVEDYHGTAVAGVIAMAMNNKLGGVGVAPHVTVGAARVFCYNTSTPWKHDTDTMLGYALRKNVELIHIAVHSALEIANRLPTSIPNILLDGLRHSALMGREGKGTIHVVNVGNDKDFGYNCAFNAIIQSIYTIPVAAVSPWGSITPYSARCSAVMIAAPSSLLPHYFYTAIVDGNYSTEFGRTSAVTPLVVGIIAMTLDAYPEVTWRDVHHLLAFTGEIEKIDRSTFVINGAGFETSPDFGFGLINALKMVELALQYLLVPELRTCIVHLKPIRDNFTTSQCFMQNYSINACAGQEDEINYLEHVQLELNLAYTAWNNLEIDLISPHGTRAKILDRQAPLQSGNTSLTWVFDSIMTWGESPKGIWQILIFDRTSAWENAGFIYEMKLIMYGTKDKPAHYP